MAHWITLPKEIHDALEAAAIGGKIRNPGVRNEDGSVTFEVADDVWEGLMKLDPDPARAIRILLKMEH